MFIVGAEERAMLMLAVDQFITHTNWHDVQVRSEWEELADQLRWHKPEGKPWSVYVELLSKEDMFRLQTEIAVELAKRLKADIGEAQGNEREV